MLTSITNKQPNYWKLGLTVFAGIYFFRYIQNPETWGILDSFNLLMHEAGHWIFAIFGNTMSILGGSLNQILIPIICFGYFYFREEKFSAGLLLFLVAQNLLNVARYIGDAVVMRLPLIGGESVVHDWNALFVKFGLLRQTAQIAGFIKLLGILVFMLAIYFCVKYSFNKAESEGIIENV